MLHQAHKNTLQTTLTFSDKKITHNLRFQITQIWRSFFMLKHIKLTLFAIMYLFGTIVYAQNSVTTTASGSTYTAALAQALLDAARSTGQAVVFTNTKIEMGELTQHDVNVATNGFIQSYDVLKVSHHGEFEVTVIAYIAENLVIQNEQEREAKLLDVSKLSSVQKQLQAQKATIERFIGSPDEWLQKFYRIKNIGHEVTSISSESVKGNYQVSIMVDRLQLNKLRRIIDTFSQPNSDTTVPYGLLDSMYPCDSACIVMDTPRFIHPDLAKSLPNLYEVELSVGKHVQKIYLYLNLAAYFKPLKDTLSERFIIPEISINTPPALAYNQKLYSKYLYDVKFFYQKTNCPIQAQDIEQEKIIHYSGYIKEAKNSNGLAPFSCALATLNINNGVIINIPFELPLDKVDNSMLVNSTVVRVHTMFE